MTVADVNVKVNVVGQSSFTTKINVNFTTRCYVALEGKRQIWLYLFGKSKEVHHFDLSCILPLQPHL